MIRPRSVSNTSTRFCLPVALSFWMITITGKVAARQRMNTGSKTTLTARFNKLMLMLVLGIWRFTMGSVSVNNITSPKVEMFYWATILFSNTLGTALGDFLADDSGLGFAGGALVFAGALVLVAAAYFYTRVSHTLLFWMAFILTRPLGATLGDLLTKPHADGGFNLSRISSSFIIAIFIFACILFTPQRAGSHPGQRGANP